MPASRIKNFAIAFLAVILWNSFSPALFAWIQVGLRVLKLPLPVVALVMAILPLMLFTEVLTRILLLAALRPTTFTPTQIESWTSLDLAKFERNTQELERLGFIFLGNYTSSSFKGMMRLFVHPQKFLFAEVGQSDRISHFSSILSFLDKNWSLGVTNLNLGASANAISYAFLRKPRVLSKRFEDTSIDSLFQSISNWQQQASIELGVALNTEVSSDFYFERSQQQMVLTRQNLVKSSITWRLLEMFWCWFISPQHEWLGDYNKFAKKR
jgi:hypothetical protein